MLLSHIEIATVIKLNKAAFWVGHEPTNPIPLDAITKLRKRRTYEQLHKSCVAVVVRGSYLAFETPCDQQWIALLNAEKHL